MAINQHTVVTSTPMPNATGSNDVVSRNATSTTASSVILKKYVNIATGSVANVSRLATQPTASTLVLKKPMTRIAPATAPIAASAPPMTAAITPVINPATAVGTTAPRRSAVSVRSIGLSGGGRWTGASGTPCGVPEWASPRPGGAREIYHKVRLPHFAGRWP